MRRSAPSARVFVGTVEVSTGCREPAAQHPRRSARANRLEVDGPNRHRRDGRRRRRLHRHGLPATHPIARFGQDSSGAGWHKRTSLQRGRPRRARPEQRRRRRERAKRGGARAGERSRSTGPPPAERRAPAASPAPAPRRPSAASMRPAIVFDGQYTFNRNYKHRACVECLTISV